MTDIFKELHRIILCNDADEKCRATHELAASIFNHSNIAQTAKESSHVAGEILVPGFPPALKLVAPRELKRRGIQSQDGRNILLHAVINTVANTVTMQRTMAYGKWR